MPKIVRSHLSRDDLARIWRHIAHDNVDAADRLIDRIDRTLIMLSKMPGLGEDYARVRAGVRRFVVGNYLLFYQPIPGGIRLVRVLHSAREVDKLL